MTASPQNMAKGTKRKSWELERLERKSLGSKTWLWLYVEDWGVRTTQRLSGLEKSWYYFQKR